MQEPSKNRGAIHKKSHSELAGSVVKDHSFFLKKCLKKKLFYLKIQFDVQYLELFCLYYEKRNINLIFKTLVSLDPTT